MASTEKSAAAEEKPPVDGDSLEDIFLRLDDAADLARASIACTAFRGIITGRDFRRRFDRLHHQPPLLGFLDYEGPATIHELLHPRRHPRRRSLHHVSTPAARAVAGAADFACSFLSEPGAWRIRDSSGGRLLLSTRGATDFRDLIVCDPLHCTFVWIPPVPDHLIAAGKQHRHALGWFPFLVPPPAGEKEKEPELQVVWMLQRVDTMTSFVFSSSTWEWRRVPTFVLWMHEHPLSLSYRVYAHGCFYWTSCQFRSHTALKLDIGKMKFSTILLPSVTQGLGRTNFIVEARDNDLGALVLGNHSLDLYCSSRTSREGNGVDADAVWRHSRTVPLPNDSLHYSVVGAADGYFLLQAYPLLNFTQQTRTRQARYFSLKLKTLVFEELRVSFNKQIVFVHLYTNFPPLLSLPSVCNEEKTSQDQGVTGEASAT